MARTLNLGIVFQYAGLSGLESWLALARAYSIQKIAIIAPDGIQDVVLDADGLDIIIRESVGDLEYHDKGKCIYVCSPGEPEDHSAKYLIGLYDWSHDWLVFADEGGHNGAASNRPWLVVPRNNGHALPVHQTAAITLHSAWAAR